jgi:pyruvate,orthophosphate dikinase
MAMIWLGDVPDLDPRLVGGKARSLNRMRALGLPVPPAFVLSTDDGAKVVGNGGRLTDEVLAGLRDGLGLLERATGRTLGDATDPLLVSVRSGAAVSMPGMMDTVLNLGVADAAVGRQADVGFAADTRSRFAEQFERVVGVPSTGEPWTDLVLAVEAVFASWNSLRAKAYRDHHGIGETGATSVTVQAMVFGNYDDDSGTGVVFSRDPLTGDPTPHGEWLPRGQGEDVVSGRFDAKGLDVLRTRLPAVHAELLEAAAVVEADARDAQDVEFTVESGRLWLLQTRTATRSAHAAVRIAVDLAEEGVITRDEAVAMVTDAQLAAATAPHVDPRARRGATLLASGLPACPGVAHGRVVATCDEAEDLADRGVDVVLARPTTDPGDVSGMVVAAAIVTEIGGSTSHAAVVSRELGTPCVVGCGTGVLGALVGRTVTVDGASGEIFDGVLPLAGSHGPEHDAAAVLRRWSERSRRRH